MKMTGITDGILMVTGMPNAQDTSKLSSTDPFRRISEQTLYTKRKLRIICVGAGAAGLQLAYKAERLLENVELQIYEKNDDIGGTWLENRYPGCVSIDNVHLLLY